MDMRDLRQANNIKALIRHYETQMPDGVVSWGYQHCVAGMAYKLGLISDRIHTGELADVMGIPTHQAQEIVAGPRVYGEWKDTTPEDRRRSVISMLQGLLRGENVNWAVPKI